MGEPLETEVLTWVSVEGRRVSERSILNSRRKRLDGVPEDVSRELLERQRKYVSRKMDEQRE